jgi:hypothetical protein
LVNRWNRRRIAVRVAFLHKNICNEFVFVHGHQLQLAMANDCDLAWCAGLFDGEGSVYIARQHRLTRPSMGYSLRLCMSSVHKPTLERFCEILGRGRVIKHSRGRIGKDRHSWQISGFTGDAAMTVLDSLRPWLVTKLAESEIVRHYAVRPRTFFPKGGRPEHVRAALEKMRTDLMEAKRYEWKHDQPIA